MKTCLRLAVVLSIVALLGVGAQAAEDEIVLDLSSDTTSEIAAETAAADEVDFSSALEPLAITPAAICRMRPQCDVDADCDGVCGTGSGDCVRAKCPIRVCRCD